MRLIFILGICLVIFSCKKNEEKAIQTWQLKQYVEFDSLGDRTEGFSYSEECPFKNFEIKENTWSKYDVDCGGVQIDITEGYYSVDEDTLIVDGLDLNGNSYADWYLINRLTRKKMEIELIRSKDVNGEWQWVDKRTYSYVKS